MKKKLLALLALTFFANTTNPITWSDWSPISIWKTRNLSPDKKTIRSIIKNCDTTSLDTKFNLERFLEKEQPRTMYEWIKVLKINYSLMLATQELAKVNADPKKEYFRFETPSDIGTTTRNRIATINYWNDQIQGYKSQRSLLEARLSFLPNVTISTADRNFINPTCADQILTNLEKAFPYLTGTIPTSSPLPLDHISILLQITGSLPSQQQNQIKTILEKNPTNLVFLFFQLWAINEDATQKDIKAALLNKIAKTAWQNSPQAQEAQAQKDAVSNATSALNYCNQQIAAHDYTQCNSEETQLRNAQATLQTTLTKNAPLEEPFKQKFSQDFTTNPISSLVIPSSLAQTATRYLKSYYPGLS